MTRCLIAETAQQSPRATALMDKGGLLTYADLDRITEATARSLYSRGVRAGEPVAILSENRLEYVPLLFGLARLGAVACPLSSRLPVEELVRQLENIGCGRVLVSEMFQDRVPAARFDACSLTVSMTPPGAESVRLPDSDEAATIVHTSGSSSVPKAVRHRWSSHVASAVGSNKNIKLVGGDRWLLSLPLYHVGGLAILFRCFLAGATVGLPDWGESLSDSLVRLKPTHLSLVPTQLRRLLDGGIPTPDRVRLKGVLVGGAEAPPALIELAVAHSVPLFTSYGSTEMGSQIATTRPGADLAELMTSGYVLPGRELSLAPDREILVRGETLCEGFVVGGQLESSFDREGWYATGDVGQFDHEGRLLVKGRKDRMFVSGGENIHPEQIERALLRLDGIVEAVVFGMEDQEYGSRPVAIVVVEEGWDVNRQGLVKQLEKSLERFKIPDRFYRYSPDPGTSAMKLDRRSIESHCRAGDLREIT